jgi:hypothetical protein
MKEGDIMGRPVMVHCKTCGREMTDEYNASDCKSDECALCINSRIMKVLHDHPKDDNDLIAKRVAVRKQRDELLRQPIVWVTCPCGRRLALRMAFRCWFCGLAFCNECAVEHFGEKPLMACVEGEVMDKS